MRDPGVVFDSMWEQRTEITLAHRDVVTLSVDHALVVESVNTIKGNANADPRLAVRPVADAAYTLGVSADRVLWAAQELGVASSAVPYAGDRGRVAPHDGRKAVLHLARHAPGDVLPYLWHHAVLRRAAHS